MGEVVAHAGAVTCVVATNRLSPYLAEALSSAAGQTAGLMEILVVDDGSPDPDALDATVAGVPLARAIHRDHQGVSSARNAGAREARGRWIAFLDDDDRWSPDRLERQLADLAALPDAVVGYCGLRTIDEAGAELVGGEHVQVEGRADILRRRTGILAGNTLILREAFERVGGFDESVPLAEDLDLVIRLAGCGPFVMTAADLVDYRLHAGNTTGRYRDLCRGIRHVLASHAALAREAGDAEATAALKESQRANDRYAWWSAGRAARAGGPIAALREYAWAMRFAPRAPADAVRRRLRD